MNNLSISILNPKQSSYSKKVFTLMFAAILVIFVFSLINFSPQQALACCWWPPEPTYSISGMKFNDENENGTKDCSELGLEGWTITIQGPCCFSDSTITNEEGNYSFSFLFPGSYTVCEVQQEGWEQTYPVENNGCHSIEIEDEGVEGVDFGNYQTVPKVVTILAYKIVCESEEDLPNLGDGSSGPAQITADTAGDYITTHPNCHLTAGWEFQWGFHDKQGTEGVDKLAGPHIGPADGTPSSCAMNCGSNTNTGAGYNDWKNFDSSTGAETPAQAVIDGLEDAPGIWVRENLKEDYIPFTYPPKGGTEDNVSAEMYCHEDIYKYDNYDLINSLELGETYYCIAFNAPEAEEPEPYCGDGEVNGDEVCEIGDTQPCQTPEGYNGDQTCSQDCMGWEECQSTEYCGDGIINGGEECEYNEDCSDGMVCNGCVCEIAPTCTPGETQSCSTGQLGICAAGTQTCDQDGFWGECVQDEEPALEICDNQLDDDCDGYTDCVDEDCFSDPACQEPPVPVCGNGILEGDEECDDGNIADGDGCSSICEIEEIQPGDIIINEIMQNPEVVTDTYGEWFELYNTTNREIDLEGCVISDNDSDSHTINTSLVVSAGGYVVLARNGDLAENGGVSADYVYSGLILSNSDDEIILECNETEIDRVEYDGGLEFPDPTGASMILANPAFDNNIGSNWCVSYSSFGDGDLGTPGAQNDSCDLGTAIIGCKYNDANNNGQIDPEEEKLGGWTIVLEIQDGLDWINVTSAATQGEGDNQGCYLFEALETGNYRISERLNDQPGWVQTYPSTLSHIISLGEDQTVSNVDFANYYEPVCGNSVLDDGEECDDGNAEDGDGCSATCTIEEQPGCEPGETQSCNTGLLGICALGTQTCTELGVWGECVQNEEPTNEVCNDGLDNDCDGSTDCGDGDCASYPACHGGPGPDPLFIFNEKIEEILGDAVIVAWSTNVRATSRVVYDTASHPDVGNPPNYGYAYSTETDVNKVKFHRVTITGLTSKTTYFWRPISHKSWPEVLGEELTFTFEEPECEPEETQPCDTGQLGICALGTQTCDQNGFWGECVQDEESVDEICDDGLDNNCDGDTDCDDSVCVSDPFCIGGGPECTLGETQSCDTGLLGICALGTQTCIQGGFWGECVQNNNPVSEICDNGLDDDCDGYVDEADPNCAGPGPVCTDYYKDSDADGYGVTDNSQCLTEPTGDYIVTQTGDCDDDNPEINPGIIEVCDNQLDDDCDEDIDCDDEDCFEALTCVTEGELEEEEFKEEELKAGLDRFLAAIGGVFNLENLCWLWVLILILVLVLIYLFLSRRKKKEEEKKKETTSLFESPE